MHPGDAKRRQELRALRIKTPSALLAAWIESNIMMQLASAPFDKQDKTLAPDAGSCVNCPKRTSFNKLLFPVTGRRPLSAEARRRIADAQKAPWTKARAQKPASSIGKKPKPPRVMSIAARRRIAAAQRARWAKIREKRRQKGQRSGCREAPSAISS
jgi:hypothetical protein